ncbi:MAG: hypothetical protein ACK2T4_09690 [Candidatus Promineifilaceae bacterium]
MKKIIKRKLGLIAALLLLALLAACSPQNNDNSQSSIKEGTVIIYKREGGIAGISQEWVIHMDGNIDGPGDQELAVPADDVQKVVEKGLESDFNSLASETANTETCCDQMTYILTVVSGDDEWRLITTDTADQPKEVTELFIMVQALISEAEPAS